MVHFTLASLHIQIVYPSGTFCFFFVPVCSQSEQLLGLCLFFLSLLSTKFLLLELSVWGHGHADMLIMDILSVRSLDGGVFYFDRVQIYLFSFS